MSWQTVIERNLGPWFKIQPWNMHTSKVMSNQVWVRSYSVRGKALADYQGKKKSEVSGILAIKVA